MHVLMLSCVYPPEPVVSSQTSAQIACALSKRGHTVTVLAPFPSRPGGRLYTGYTRSLWKRETDPNGCELIRCFATLSPVSKVLNRFLENISFGLTAGIVALFIHRPSLIYANTWPIFATGIAALVARLRGIPLVVSVQDLYPESLVSQRRISANGRSARLLRALDVRIARACRAIIVISEAFASTYRLDRGIPAERIHIVPNWEDEARFRYNGDPNVYRQKRGIPVNARVLVYSGNIGAAAGVSILIQAMSYLRDLRDLYVIIAGEGSELAACQSLAQETGDSRIIFQSPYPAQLTAEVLASADVLVMPTRGEQSLVSVPSKLIGYMLAERPVIATALPHSDLAKTIEKAGCGWVVPPNQPELLAHRIREVVQLDRATLCGYGSAGRAFALKNSTADVCVPRVMGILEDAAV